MAHITRKKILQQLKADLIGKDSHRGVTLTYSWFANQFGHFSLGFIPTLFLYSYLIKKQAFDQPELFAPIAISFFWLAFELYNFLGPLLRKRQSVTKILYVPGKTSYKFKPAYWNIGFDTFTDLCFFWVGAFTASIFLKSTPEAKTTLAIILVVLAYPAYYWFLTKMYLQNAFYPIQFRLSQWNFGISKEDNETVTNFLKKKELGHHLFIFGGENKGKTSLSVGLGTEYSIKHNSSLYLTASKLYTYFTRLPEEQLPEDKSWTWRNSSMLIIDDINPGPPVDEIISAKKFLTYLNCTEELGDINGEIIKNKNIVWVLGSDESDHESISEWIEMLEKLGVEEEKIHSIII